MQDIHCFQLHLQLKFSSDLQQTQSYFCRKSGSSFSKEESKRTH